jgi:hypothetical protein
MELVGRYYLQIGQMGGYDETSSYYVGFGVLVGGYEEFDLPGYNAV